MCSHLEILWEKSSSNRIRLRQNHKISPYGFHFWENYPFKNHINLILICIYFFLYNELQAQNTSFSSLVCSPKTLAKVSMSEDICMSV